MKAAILIMVLCASNVYAAEVIKLKNGVMFDHHSHQTDRVGICAVCHEKSPGRIEGFSKSWAHKNCIACHDLYNEGPTSCGGCHKF